MADRQNCGSTLRWIVLVVLAVWGVAGHAIGLGQLQVQSWLGSPLRVAILLVGTETLTSACVKARIESPDGNLIASPKVNLTREKQSTSIVLRSDQPINEPVVAVSVTLTCETPVHRDYQVLLDPPVLTAELPRSDLVVASTASQSSAGSVPAGTPDRHSEAKSRYKKNDAQREKPARNSAARKQISSVSAGRSARPDSARTSHSVLRLSSDTSLNPGTTLSPLTNSIDKLKLERDLSAPRNESNPKTSEDIQEAQSRFAALLRDEDPLKIAKVQARTAIEQRQILQAEVNVLRDENQLNKAKLDELQKKKSYSMEWIIGLAGLLVTSLISIAWLAWRLRSTRRSDQRKWWENIPSNDSLANESAPDEPLAATRTSAKQLPLKTARTNTRTSAPRRVTETGFLEKRLEQRLAAKTEQSPAERESGRKNSFPFHGLLADTNPDTLPPSSHQVEMIKVEEISDTLQEVEFWMLLNDRARALEILEPLGEVEKPDSPAPWLYLLDTYAEMGDQAKYEALRERCEHIFNVQIARWEEKDAGGTPRGLDEFPHLMEQICVCWKGDRVVEFLESLLVDDREGSRAGFELPVYRDLMLLIALAKEIQPPKPPAESAATA